MGRVWTQGSLLQPTPANCRHQNVARIAIRKFQERSFMVPGSLRQGPCLPRSEGNTALMSTFFPFSLLSVHMMVGARSHCFFYFNSTLSQNSKSISVNSRFLKTALHSPTLLSLSTHACTRTHTHTHTHTYTYTQLNSILVRIAKFRDE